MSESMEAMLNKNGFTKVKKRDGRLVPFDLEKIIDAIFSAAKEVGGHNRNIAKEVGEIAISYLIDMVGNDIPTVEEVQDSVEKALIETGHAKTAKAYIIYREKRSHYRHAKSDLMNQVATVERETLRDNANVGNSPSAKMLQVGMAASKEYYLSNLIPDDIVEAYRKGDVHIHDLDYYGKTINCMQIPLEKLLKEGFNTGYGYIRPPKRISSAVMLSCIILQSCQNDMYGGQAFPWFDKSMKNYVPTEYKELLDKKEKEGLSEFEEKHLDSIVDEVYQSMEALVYNLNTMHSRAGAQVPFSSINFGTDTSAEGRLINEQLLKAFGEGLGNGETPIFPNLIFRVKKGVNFNPEDPNYDLYRLALKVAGRRMNPTFSFMDSSFNEVHGDKASYMGCRSRVMADRHGEDTPEARGNVAPISINLPRLGIVSNSIIEFFDKFDKVIDLCEKQLMHRYEVCKKLKVKDLPFVMGQGIYVNSEGLDLNDSIEEAMKHGTLSIGFIGLAECLKALIGEHHGESEEAQELGLKIIKHLKDRLDRLSEEYDLNFTCYATPAEGLSGRFIAIDKDKFGSIEGITDKDFYTNSFHVPVYHDISFEEKIKIEGPYHSLTNAGHISYIELPSAIEDNIEALESIHRAMSEADMGYAGINFPIDECLLCNHSGIIEDDECPVCGHSEIRRVRRVTGYLSTLDRFAPGKKAEYKKRVDHLCE
ncbi:anaerobic ribonucleoside-triphosphate reductase [Halonatronum saccharophilum]|uniref:anaerobic ribonucleoside-triphosphate reductase n=1 Tax=Halonatronum saccharophilum TaxID=150060 RepID=UPI0004AE8A04|nr:anaerobic ribonucleoside-triphosphate reductase [Halonatronum saccharophilum]